MKKIRKGDVVVINYSWLIPGMDNGCLGLVEQANYASSEIRYGKGKNNTTCFTNSFLEVIDHIDETPEPIVGDVIVKNRWVCPGLLGIIERIENKEGRTVYYIYYGGIDVVGQDWTDDFEVIDHIDETPVSKFEFDVGDRVIYTGGNSSREAVIEEEFNGKCDPLSPLVSLRNGKSYWLKDIGIAHESELRGLKDDPEHFPLEQGFHQLLCRHGIAKQDDPRESLSGVLGKVYGLVTRLETESKKRFEENGYEYWLEQSKDNGLYLMKQCKTCKSLHPQVVRMLSKEN